MDHLLTCACGREISVTPKQAGQTLDCSCGQRLTVPTLRGLAKLPLAQASRPAASGVTTTQAARSTWSGWRGPLFAMATGISIVAALSCITFLVQRSSIDTSYTAETEIAIGNDFFEGYSPVELSLSWNDYQKFNLGQKMRPPFYQMLKIAEKLKKLAIISGSVWLLSAGLACGVWVSTRGRHKARRL